jgi:hypothetical protein
MFSPFYGTTVLRLKPQSRPVKSFPPKRKDSRTTACETTNNHVVASQAVCFSALVASQAVCFPHWWLRRLFAFRISGFAGCLLIRISGFAGCLLFTWLAVCRLRSQCLSVCSLSDIAPRLPLVPLTTRPQSFLLLVPILAGREPFLLPEGADEILRVVVAQLRGDILDRHIGLGEPFFSHIKTVVR